MRRRGGVHSTACGAELGRLDILVNDAGWMRRSSAAQRSDEDGGWMSRRGE
ncbi:hypothetical protein [Sorangium sp. So ce426]|uniref:hypothetical protein n=1 Tax=unclassified Sorangium TaxID=2621164 RepID=UPI003F5B0C01